MNSNFRKHQILVFILTFVSYATFHITRKVFSNVKYSLQTEWGLSTIFMGTLDTTFLICYSICLYISGILGDRVSLRWMNGLSMILTGIVVALFGAARALDIHSHSYFLILWALCGIFQSAGWPCNVAIMGNWFTGEHRGSVFGLWSANMSVGNVFGALLASWCLASGLPWSSVFYFSSFIIIGWGIVTSVLLTTHPSSVHQNLPTDARSGRSTQEIHEHKANPISFLQAWLIPGVFLYAIANAFIKLVNYSLFFWLPYYLVEALHYGEDKANMLSTLYDVGGIIGGIIFGYFSDYLHRRKGGRSLVIVPMLGVSFFSFYLFRFSTTSPSTSIQMNTFWMFVSGMLVNGAYNLVGSAISVDLGTHKLLQGNAAAMGTVTGIIDGTGSFGAAVGQILVAYFSSRYGWDAVFYMLMASIFMSALCLANLFVKEMNLFVQSNQGLF